VSSVTDCLCVWLYCIQHAVGAAADGREGGHDAQRYTVRHKHTHTHSTCSDSHALSDHLLALHRAAKKMGSG